MPENWETWGTSWGGRWYQLYLAPLERFPKDWKEELEIGGRLKTIPATALRLAKILMRVLETLKNLLSPDFSQILPANAGVKIWNNNESKKIDKYLDLAKLKKRRNMRVSEILSAVGAVGTVFLKAWKKTEKNEKRKKWDHSDRSIVNIV